MRPAGTINRLRDFAYPLSQRTRREDSRIPESA